jgi:hypothetical protein
MVVGLLVQFSLGMAANLYATIPAHHSGAHPSDFFSGSARSVAWAIAHGPGALPAHAVLGLLLAVNGVSLFVGSLRLGGRPVLWATALGGLFVIGAGFNGVAFIDYGHDANSLVMALLFAAAVLCYVLALLVVGATSEDDSNVASTRVA